MKPATLTWSMGVVAEAEETERKGRPQHGRHRPMTTRSRDVLGAVAERRMGKVKGHDTSHHRELKATTISSRHFLKAIRSVCSGYTLLDEIA